MVTNNNQITYQNDHDKFIFEHPTMTYWTLVKARLAEMADARARIVGKSKLLP